MLLLLPRWGHEHKDQPGQTPPRLVFLAEQEGVQVVVHLGSLALTMAGPACRPLVQASGPKQPWGKALLHRVDPGACGEKEGSAAARSQGWAMTDGQGGWGEAWGHKDVPPC